MRKSPFWIMKKLIDSKNRRLVFFGKFAGNAGMVEYAAWF